MDFDRIVSDAWASMPGKFKAQVENVAVLIEDEPSETIRREEQLGEGETLLGLYHGINRLERGQEYGVGGTLPDTITLYKLPLLEEAEELLIERPELGTLEGALKEAVRETLWHELGHYFGLSDPEIHVREDEGTNSFS